MGSQCTRVHARGGTGVGGGGGGELLWSACNCPCSATRQAAGCVLRGTTVAPGAEEWHTPVLQMMIIGEPPFDDDMPLFPPDKNPDASPQDQPGDEQFPNNSLQYNSLPYGTIHLQQHPQPHEYPQWYNQGCPQQPEWQQQQQQQQGWLPTHSNSYQPEAAGPYQHQQASYQQHPRQSHQPQAGPPWPYFNQPGQQFQQGPPEQEPAPEHLLLRPTDLWPSPDGLSGGPPCSPGQNQVRTQRLHPQPECFEPSCTGVYQL